jgi:DNA mismatch repair protein MutS
MEIAMVTDLQAQSQYRTAKEKSKGAIALVRVGDFYKTYDDDAETVARLCGTLTKMNDDVKYTEFPKQALDFFLPRLVSKGHRVCICEANKQS